VIQSCAVGRSHTSDASLERVFNQHEAEFDELLGEILADSQLTTVQTRNLIYRGRLVEVSESNYSEAERLGLPKASWVKYQKQMRSLGVTGIMKGEGGIEFRVDPGTMFNGDSYKGYWYRPTPPGHVQASLDGYRVSDRDLDKFGGWLVFRPISQNWYLYLFVNG
jgi:hypothetical protein